MPYDPAEIEPRWQAFWNENKTFIRGKYTAKEGAKPVESGEEIIGKDDAEGAIGEVWVVAGINGLAREGADWYGGCERRLAFA